jgi:D-alanyl-D-alanine carboxypeptidase
LIGGLAACALASALVLPNAARAEEALLVVEVESGKVLQAENATRRWYPASLTKIMTAYVALRAVKEGRLALDSPLKVSANAAAQQPSKMGFKAGTVVTVDNAIKMLMVKSANDIAVVIAEGVSGSIENFATEMNRTASHLGMTQSHFVNPNGLPAEEQISSARDLAILARAVIQEFPEYKDYWDIPAIKFGKRTMRNYNTLIGRYPGADGMKTGFICASGFNLVATASRNGKRLIAVVLGAPSSPVRAVKAAQLLETGFNVGPFTWLTPALGTVNSLVPINAQPPNLRDEMCGPNRRRPAAESLDEEENDNSGGNFVTQLSNLRAPALKPSELLQPLSPIVNPVRVFVGSPKQPAGTKVAKQAAPANNRKASANAAGSWTTLSATSSANAPAAGLAPKRSAEPIPLPRARPKTRRSSRKQ